MLMNVRRMFATKMQLALTRLEGMNVIAYMALRVMAFLV